MTRMTSAHCPPFPFQSWDEARSSPSPPWWWSTTCPCLHLSSETTRNKTYDLSAWQQGRKTGLPGWGTILPVRSLGYRPHRSPNPPFHPCANSSVWRTFSNTAHYAAGELIQDRPDKHLLFKKTAQKPLVVVTRAVGFLLKHNQADGNVTTAEKRKNPFLCKELWRKTAQEIIWYISLLTTIKFKTNMFLLCFKMSSFIKVIWRQLRYVVIEVELSQCTVG